MYTPNLHFSFTAESYIPDLHFDFTDNAVTGYVAVTLDDAQGSAIGEYDSNVSRKFSATFLASSSDTSRTNISINALSQQPYFNHINACEQQHAAQAIIIQILADLQQMLLSTIKVQAVEQDAVSLINNWLATCNLTNFLTTIRCASVQNASSVYLDTLSVQDVLTFIMQDSHALSTDTLAQLVNRLCVNVPYSIKLNRRSCDKSQQAIQPAFGKSIHIDLPRPPPLPQSPDHQIITIPTKEVYQMQHTIVVATYPDNIPVKLNKISLSYDVDSYAWAFSGVLTDKAQLSLFNMTSFESVKLAITINGYRWIVLVEKIPERKSFGKTDITLTGRSLSVLLSAPWQQLSSFTAGSDMTVQQIADSLIPYDWTIDWQCPTWLVPANTYSYTQQTRLQALKLLADNIGAVLIPARDSQTLIIKPRYPVLPWNYHATGIQPDLIIPDAAIESIGLESRTQSPINGVYVHGENNGVLAFCRLNGTAGDVLAPTESNALITDVAAARALGERILAGKATQPLTTSITTFLGGNFLLAEIGWLVEVNNERAIINGISVETEFGKVRQNITVGENTSNAYAKLLNLLPAQPLLVGNVITSYDNKSILTLLDGGVITARGMGTVGLNYYVRNGLIESAAPNLSSFDIVI
jgi:hypothetical protein